MRLETITLKLSALWRSCSSLSALCSCLASPLLWALDSGGVLLVETLRAKVESVAKEAREYRLNRIKEGRDAPRVLSVSASGTNEDSVQSSGLTETDPGESLSS